jgi:hypothetical protein
VRVQDAMLSAEAVYFAFGDAYVYVIGELPDNKSAAVLSLAANVSEGTDSRNDRPNDAGRIRRCDQDGREFPTAGGSSYSAWVRRNTSHESESIWTADGQVLPNARGGANLSEPGPCARPDRYPAI